jgi:hypothetical protein
MNDIMIEECLNDILAEREIWKLKELGEKK